MALTAGAATPAVAQGPEDPPLCTDEQGSIGKVRYAYNISEQLGGKLEVKEFADVKEISYGPAPKGVNQYASSTTYGTNSRWCQATITLSDGQSETLYWEMDFIHDGERTYINLNYCSARHDTWQNQCEDLKAGK